MKKWLMIVLPLLTITVPALADAPVDGRVGRAEIRFLEGMIDHHQMALDMANDCLDKVETQAVSTLCQNVIDAQSAEIELMQSWLLDWYGITYTPMSMTEMQTLMDDLEASDGGGHSGHGTALEVVTDPAMMMGMFAGFSRLEGQDYEVAWLESMIDHHDDALHMSERILTVGEHDALRELAQAIIDTQTAEIEYMEGLLVDLAG